MSEVVVSELVREGELEQQSTEIRTDADMDRLVRIAKALADSGYWDDIKSAQQAFAKLIFGRDLGLGPAQSLTEIQLIRGKPELSANLQASLVKEHPRYDYKVKFDGEQSCSVQVLEDGEPVGVSTFTLEDAKRAGLSSQVWKAYPRNMLFARAMTNAVAWYCPDVTRGIRLYGQGELGGPVTDVTDA